MNLVSVLRCTCFYEKNKKDEKLDYKELIFFLILIIIAGIFTYQNIYSLIPIIIGILYTYSIWQKNLTVFRMIYVIAAVGWIIYNVIVGAYITIIGNTLEFLFGLCSIWKNDLKKH